MLPIGQNIGIFLLTIVCGDKDLWVVSEALDSAFDVFGEDHLDSIDHDIGLTDRLSKFVPEMKSRVSEKMWLMYADLNKVPS